MDTRWNTYILHKPQFFFILLLLVISGVMAAQENCSNGIDDDGDGLIDCLDADCHTQGATSVASSPGVTNPNNALGLANNNFAQLYDSGDRLTLDFGTVLSPGTVMSITWRRKPSYGSGPQADMVIEESTNNSSFTENSVRPGTTSQSWITTLFVLENSARYLRFRTETGSNDDFDLDAVTFSIVCNAEICGNGLDDDGDGASDENCTNCVTGSISLERWLGISGSSIGDLTGNANYPNNPSETGTLTSFQGPNGYADDYGTRVRGFLRIPVSDIYQLILTGDDNTELYLSNDGDPANAQLIASVPDWTNVNEYNKYPEQTSAYMYLEAGAHYYIELLHKEGGGGDHFTVYYTNSTITTPTILPGSSLSEFTCCTMDAGTDEEICYGSSVTLSTTPTGIGSLSYSWSPSTGLNNATIQNPIASPTSTTTYTVTVTDGDGCTATDDIEVTVYPELIASVPSETICLGETTSVNPSASGGSSPYSYSWGGQPTSGNTLTATPSSTTTYTVTVTDDNGCTATAQTIITVNTLPSVTFSQPTTSVCISTSTLALSGGSPSGGTYYDNNGYVSGTTFDVLSAGSGTHRVYYTYTNGNGCTDEDFVDIAVYELPTVSLSLGDDAACETEPFITLSGGSPGGGTYSGAHVSGINFDVSTAGAGVHTITYTYTDGNGCTNTATDQIEVFSEPSASYSSVNPICNMANGSITITFSDDPARSQIEFSLDDGVSYESPVADNSGSITYSSLIDGTYDVWVRWEEDECPIDLGDAVLVQQNVPLLNAGPNQTVCEGDDVTLTATSTGNGPFTYNWNQGLGAGATHTFTTSLPSYANQTTTYTVTVTDTNGCTSTDEVNVTVRSLPVVTVTHADATCEQDNGSITFTFADHPNRSNIEFSINGGGSYSNYQDNIGSTTIGSLATGNYDLMVRWGDDSCPVDITDVTITNLSSPALTISTDTNICDGESTTISASATGNGTMTYSWDNGLGNGSSHTVSPTVTGYADESTTYNVTVTDENGCTGEGSVTITVSDFPVITSTSTDETCTNDNGVITLTIDNYPDRTQMEVTTDGDFDGANVYTINDNVGTYDITGLSAGTYDLWVRWGEGDCPVDLSDEVLNDISGPVLSTGSNLEFCLGETDNTTLTITGGTSPYNISWTGPGGFTSTDENPEVSQGGIYNVTVTDANLCTATESQLVFVFNLPSVFLNLPVDTVCQEDIAFPLSGGSPNGGTYSGVGVVGTDFDPQVAGPGEHEITYTYDNGTCTNMALDTIVVLPAPTVNFVISPTFACFEDFDIALGGGTPAGGTYSGVGVENGSTFNTLISGIGNFEIVYSYTGANGCISRDTQILVVHDLPPVSLALSDDFACVEETMHALDGGIPAGGVFSGPGVTGTNFEPYAAGIGIHTIVYTVTDANGCNNTAVDEIEVDGVPDPNLVLPQDSICLGETLTLTGGSPAGGTYMGTGVSGGVFDATVAGLGEHEITYEFAISSCNNTVVDTITVLDLPIVTLSLPDNEACFGDQVTLSGGSPAGGTWSGPGVTGNNFDSTLPGAGVHTITYTYLDIDGCSSVATEDIIVHNNPTVTLTLPVEELCINNGLLTLSGESPSGGTWSGPGVTGNTFDPMVAGVGLHTITYSYTDANGCSNQAGGTIRVRPVPSVFLSLWYDEACPGDSPETLRGGWPLGGTWSGPGVSGNTIDPAAVGVGDHTITYSVTNNGCTSSATDIYTVYPEPVATFTLSQDSICIGEDLLLNTGIPSGGFYFGTGVNTGSSTFISANAGVGQHEIEYAYTDANGCDATSVYDTITVIDLPAASLTLATDEGCSTGPNVALSGGSPAGGVYTGTGVTGSVFDPTVAGPGVHQITYTYTNSEGCDAVAVDNIFVDPAPDITDVIIEDERCDRNDGSITVEFNNQSGVSFLEFSLNGGLSWQPRVRDNEGWVTFNNLPADSYDLVVRNWGGTCESVVGTYVVNNQPGPNANAGSDVTITIGNSTTLSGSGGEFYRWTPSSGLSNNSVSNPVASPSETTTYTLEVTDIYGCTDTDEVTVTVQLPCAGSITDGQYPYFESFESNLGLWNQESTDDFNWTRDNNGTNSSNTGPSSGSAGSYYMYAEAGNHFGETAILNSPCFDLDDQSCAQFTFDYHMYGNSNMGTLTLQASNDFGQNWLTLRTISGNQGNQWYTEVVDLFGYLDDNLILRFVADIGNGNQSDIAIDNVQFITTGCGCAATANPFLNFSLVPDPQPVSADIDCDGDADMLAGSDGMLFFFENNGDGTYTDQTGTANDFMPPLSFQDMTIGLVDLDNDGDLDMSIVGEEPTNKFFYWNTGTKTNPIFTAAGTGGTPANPISSWNLNALNGGQYIGYAAPTIFWADLDNDGDFDAVVGGKLGWFLYFENIGDEFNPNFIQQVGAANPFQGLRVDGADEGNGYVQYESSPFLIDWDGDGDLDLFSGNQISTVQFYENVGTSTNPAYVERTGNANPFDGVIFSEDSHLSIIDEDCDGDWDVFYGVGDTNEDAEITLCDLLVSVPNFANVNASQSHYCIGETIFLFEDSQVGVAWNWSGPNGFTSTEQSPFIANATDLAAGTYYVTMTNEQGCEYVNEITITLSTTEAEAGPDVTINQGEQYQHIGTGSGVTFMWTPTVGLSDPNVPNPIAAPPTTTTYTLAVTDEYGCTATDQMTIYVRAAECVYDEDLFFANFEDTTGDNNWTLGNGASDGNFVIGQPSPYIQSGITVMEIAAQEGSQMLLTGNANNYTQDLDGGPSTARSPNITLPNNASLIIVNLFWYLSHYTNGDAADYLVIEIRDASNNNVLTTLVNESGTNTDRDAAWAAAAGDLTAFAGNTIYIYVRAADIGNGSKLEVAIDNVTVTGEFVNEATLDLPITTVCEGLAPFALTGGTPVGGTYSGPGVSGGIFDPATAGPGPHEIAYEYDFADGCVATALSAINVLASPQTELELSVGESCEVEMSVGLFGGLPTGGIYSGSGVTGSTIDPSVAGVGTHTITYTVTDANGCVNSATDDFVVNPAPEVVNVAKVDASCSLDNGSITITYSDNPQLDSIQFSLDGGVTWETSVDDQLGSVTYTDLAIGYYDIRVRSQNAVCPQDVADMEIFDQAGPQVDAGSDDDICNGEDYNISPLLELGTAPFVYAWEGPGGFTASTLDITVSVGGTYTITVTDDNGCSSTDEIEISSFDIGLETTIVDESCFGSADGRLLFNAIGVAPFTYTLSGQGSNSTGVFNNLIAGYYQVTVEDAAGCTIDREFSIAGPVQFVCSQDSCLRSSTALWVGTEPWTVASGSTTITMSVTNDANTSISNVDLGATLTSSTPAWYVESAGGAPSLGLRYSWDTTPEATDTDIDSGSDDKGTATITFTFSESVKDVVLHIDRLGQYGGTDDIVSNSSEWNLTTGGVSMRKISGTEDLVVSTQAFYKSGDIEVTITEDASQNTGDGTAAGSIYFESATPFNSLTFNVTGLGVEGEGYDELELAFSTTVCDTPVNQEYTCDTSEGRATVAGCGGIHPYTYAWDNGDTTPTSSGLSPGIHRVTITDANGCTTSCAVTINDNQIMASTSPNISFCEGDSGTISGTASGGTAPYTYNWTGPDSFMSSLQSPTVTEDGIYTLTVEDTNGCTATADVRVYAFVCDSESDCYFMHEFNNFNYFGSDGSESWSAYSWDEVSDNNSSASGDVMIAAGELIMQNTDGTPPSIQRQIDLSAHSSAILSFSFRGLGTLDSGDRFYVEVFDGSSWVTVFGWAGAVNTTITPWLDISPFISANTQIRFTIVSGFDEAFDWIAFDNVRINADCICTGLADAGPPSTICAGESATLAGSGGIAWSWSPVNGLDDPNSQTPVATPDGTITYTLTSTDENGCTDTDQVTITVNDLPDVSVDDYEFCEGESFSMGATASGTGPLTYSWDPTNYLDNASILDPTATPEVTTTYTISVTDANGCIATDDMIATRRDTTVVLCERYRIRDEANTWGPWINFGGGDCSIVLCEENGLQDIQFDGGPEFSTGWVWTDEDGNVSTEVDTRVVFNNISADDAGTYTGVYTNVDGCTSTVTFNISVNPSVDALASIVQHDYCEDGSGQATVTVIEGSGPFTIQWQNNMGGETGSSSLTNLGDYTITGLNAGTTYCIQVTDSNGCVVMPP